MPQFHAPLETCVLCGSADIRVVLPLRPIPVSSPNSKALSGSAAARREMAPLDMNQCRRCGHLQIASVVSPEFLYRNYLYRTAVSVGLRDHFRGLADEVSERLGIQAGNLVVEIGSNDGTQLSFFKARGMRVLGVDPGTAIAAAATAAGIETIAEFFDEDLARRVLAERGQARLLIANNVIANIPDLAGAMRGIRALLANDGVFVFETQYGSDVITGNLLDTVYHEHISYFLIKPLAAFLTGLGMELIHVLHVPTKGGSIRVTVQRDGGPRHAAPIVGALIAEEERLGLYASDIYRDLANRIESTRGQILAHMEARAREGRAIAGYGVSIGTSSLLHQFDLWDRIGFLVDDDREKIGVLAGPDYEIPVRSPAALVEDNPAAVVVFAWRYVERIIESQRAYAKQGGRFILPLPRFSIR